MNYVQTLKASFKPELEEALGEKTVAEWRTLFDAAGVPNGPVNTLSTAVQELQLAARGMLCETAEGIKLVSTPFNISGFQKNKPWMMQPLSKL
jgi:crotonobetainyl-CoA:carnitine CoA-transferase CaiB-like acyl-CoA transferase